MRENQKKYLGFNDTWLLFIGIPFASLILASVLFAETLNNSPADFFKICYPVNMVFTTVYWFSFRFLVIQLRKRKELENSIRTRIMVEFIAVMIIFLVLGPTLEILIKKVFRFNDALIEHNVTVGFFSTLLLSLFILSVYEIIYIQRQLERSILEKEQIGRAHLESQLQGLKSQIQPHFLFNSLNTLVGLIPQDSKRAINYVHKLSRVFRYVLEINEEPLISLDKELNFLQSYSHLIKERFGDSLKIEIDIDPVQRDKLIVPLSLQMLFENAIKHNRLGKDKPLSIKVRIDDRGRLEMTNNIQPKVQSEHSIGMGLENIKKRYKFFTEDPVEINDIAGQFSVSIPLITSSMITS